MAKRYIDKSIEEQQAERAAGFSRRMANISDVGSDMYNTLSRMATGLAKEEVFGIPGLLGDLAEPATALMNPVIYATNPEVRENLSEFQKDFGAVGLAKAAGVELSDDFLDESGELRPEMVGRMLAPGALYGKGASLLPKLSEGVQSLVRGLRDDGFFPGGGPQPATVSGPSPMTQGPRSNVFLNEDAGPTRGIGDNQPPEDIEAAVSQPPSSKPLVQAEKEDMFVSPENPAVVEQGPPDFTGNPLSGVSETGVYLPVRAALMNIDIPSGGIAANKLLEKLRGQPRAGSELRASGFADFLKGKGTEKLNRDQIDLVYNGLSPAPVIRTIMSEPYRYAGQDVSGTSFGYSGMQRQIGAEETELNYGVMLFGDAKNVVDGTATKTVEGHQYFDRHLPITYGHARFSIQTILDPETRQPIKAMLVEEIQSDLVRAFAGADRAKKSVKSVERIKNDLVKQNPDLADDDAALTLMAESQREQELANVDGVVRGLLDNKAVYGPGEKLADATLDIHPDVVKYKQMTEQVNLSEGQTDLFNTPQMRTVEQRLDDGVEDLSLNPDSAADQLKFIVLNNLHKAKTESEAFDLVKKLFADGKEIPKSRFRNHQEEEINLTPIEVAGERMKHLVKEVLSVREGAQRSVVKRQEKTSGSGIMSKLTDKFKARSVESDLNEAAREDLLFTIPFQMKESLTNRFTTQIYKRQKDNLFKARQKNLEANEKIDFFEEPDLNTPLSLGTKQMSKITGKGRPISLRKRLSTEEVLEAIDTEELEQFVDDAARLFLTQTQVLNDADPAFRGITNRYNKNNGFSNLEFLKNQFRNDIVNRLGGSDVIELAQAERYKENLINKIAEAKENAPTPRDMVSQISKILDDEKGVGDLFRRRYNLDNDTTAMDLAANPQMLSENMLDAEDYISRPPFETQNDFNQFAMRAIASEAKKLEVDAVIVPSVEEMVMARAEHGTVATGRNGVKQIEDFKKGLVQEKQVKAAIQKLRSMDKDKVLTTEDVEALGVSDMSDLNIARYGMPEKPEEFIAALENSYINMGGGRVDHLRGHFQNYGESLNAALSNLRREGFDVTELEALNARKPFVAGYTPLGEYAKQGAPELAKYRMIDLREGKKGADVAKKVPSLYNKGGHVDIRGGIGAMARSVM